MRNSFRVVRGGQSGWKPGNIALSRRSIESLPHAGWQRAVIQQPGGTSTFDYDEVDSLAQAHWLSGMQARYEYDERGDLLRAIVEPADGSAAQVADYAFDGLHRIRHMISCLDRPNPAPVRRIELEYDAAGRCAAYQT